MDMRLDRDWDKDVIAYPDPAIRKIDPRFKRYVPHNSAIERIYTGARWTEGPVWFGDGRYLLFSDIPNNRIMRWVEETGTVSVFRSPSHNSNGHTRDRTGRLISCEHGRRCVSRTEHDGRVTVLVDSYEGKRLNSPNDVVVHEDGSVWFTDPDYGIIGDYEGNKSDSELQIAVYRLDPATGDVNLVTDELEKPNGLCFSPDFSRLYISDTGSSHKEDHPHHIRVYDVRNRSELVNGRVFCDMSPASADGIRCDQEGNLWSSAGAGGFGTDGVFVFAPDGDLIGQIHLPEPVSNLCFGGLKKNRLFITAGQSVYSLYVDARGI